MSTTDFTIRSDSLQQDDEAVYVLFAGSRLARERNSAVTMDFFLAALYIVAFARLLPYFRAPEAIATFVRNEYGLTLPIWLYWARLCAALDSEGDFAMHRISPEVQEILTQAARSANLQQRKISVLDFCHAIRQSNIEACRKFVSCGIDIDGLLAAP